MLVNMQNPTARPCLHCHHLRPLLEQDAHACLMTSARRRSQGGTVDLAKRFKVCACSDQRHKPLCASLPAASWTAVDWLPALAAAWMSAPASSSSCTTAAELC